MMQKNKRSTYSQFTVYMAIVMMAFGCGKGPETVTVKPSTSELFAADTLRSTDGNGDEEDFIHIKLSETGDIASLDPLFAENYSELRVINLLYDGLTRLDSSGMPAPAIARRWEVNPDSTRFTFYLNRNTRFYNSPAFANGNGRPVTSADVKFIFERMASAEAPFFAGQSFMEIRGFEAYRNEQRYIKNPAKRSLSGVEGIHTPNDSVLVFNLKQSAPDFLTRLSHPQVSIYAKESVPDSGLIQQPAGSGSFSIVQRDSNRLILAPNRNHPRHNNRLNRLDIYFGRSETETFQSFAREEADGILGVSPAILSTITDSSGALLTDFYPDYSLQQPGPFEEYNIYYNRESGQARSVNNLINSIQPASWIANEAWGKATLSLADTTSTLQTEVTRFVITQTDHPTARYMIARIAERASRQGYSFAMNASYAPFSDVTFTNRAYPFAEKVVTWKYPAYVLNRNLSGLSISGEAWNLQLQQLSLEEPEE